MLDIFYEDIGFCLFNFKMFGLFGGDGMCSLKSGVYCFKVLLKEFMIIEESLVMLEVIWWFKLRICFFSCL